MTKLERLGEVGGKSNSKLGTMTMDSPFLLRAHERTTEFQRETMELLERRLQTFAKEARLSGFIVDWSDVSFYGPYVNVWRQAERQTILVYAAREPDPMVYRYYSDNDGVRSTGALCSIDEVEDLLRETIREWENG